MSNALADVDYGLVGDLMLASHRSMRDDFDTTLPEIDDLVASMAEAIGRDGGARMTGGGFGGCVVAIVASPARERLEHALVAHWSKVGCSSPLQTFVTPAQGAHVLHKPRLLSDNGPSYVASELADYLADKDMRHVRGAWFHPQMQGKIERWHQTLKIRILLENYYLPGDLEAQVEVFVEHYNHQRYHESLKNVTPAVGDQRRSEGSSVRLQGTGTISNSLSIRLFSSSITGAR